MSFGVPVEMRAGADANLVICRVDGHSWAVKKFFGVEVYRKDLKTA